MKINWMKIVNDFSDGFFPTLGFCTAVILSILVMKYVVV